MSISDDRICVWIEDGIVYAGQKRIYTYDLEDNKGYIVKDFCAWYDVEDYRDKAILLAVKVSQEANLPLKLQLGRDNNG